MDFLSLLSTDSNLPTNSGIDVARGREVTEAQTPIRNPPICNLRNPSVLARDRAQTFVRCAVGPTTDVARRASPARLPTRRSTPDHEAACLPPEPSWSEQTTAPSGSFTKHIERVP
eukprot:15460277-Alexandrium_andersonii.AAC.1